MVASGSDVTLPVGRRSVRRDAWQVKIRRSSLPGNLKILAYTLSTYGTYTGKQNRPGLPALAADIRADLGTDPLSTKTISRYLNQIEAAGWITKVSHGGGGRGTKLGADYWLTELVPAADIPETTPDIAPHEMSGVKPVDNAVDRISLRTGTFVTPDIDPPVTSNDRNDPKELLDPHIQNLVFVSSHVASQLEPETHDPFAVDDPFDRQQMSPPDEPPAHVRHLFAVAALVEDDTIPEPELETCGHGIVLGLKFGGGEYACCPPTTEDQ